MSTESRKIQLEAGVDTTQAKAGFADLKAAAKDMGAGVAQAGQQGAKSIDSLAAASTGAAAKLSANEKNLIASIQRQSAQLEAGTKSGVAYYEVLAKQRGVDVNVLRPYLDQLDQLQKKQAAAGVSVGQTTAAFRMLPAQMTDIATQLAGGQSPFLILLQQGGQIKDSFGGIGATFRALANQISPVSVAVVGVSAALATLAVGLVHAEQLQRSLNTLQAQLSGTGRASVASAADLKTLIDTLAHSPDVTREGATQVVSELTKVHGIGVGLFRDLAGAAADYAKTTGTDLPTAARTLAQAFADPAKGVKTLEDALGTLTSTQLLSIEKMTQQNDVAGAQRVLFAALEDAIKGVADRAATPLQRSLSDLGNSWSGAMKAFGDSSALIAVNKLLGQAVDSVTYLVSNAGKIGGLGTLGASMLPGGFGAAAGSALSSGFSALVGDTFTGGARRSGVNRSQSAATGISGADAANAGRAADVAAEARQTEETIKGALRLGAAYQSAAGKAADLVETQKALQAALGIAKTRYGENSEQAQKLRDQIAGVGEAIAAARKKAAGTGPADAHALALLDVEKIKSANAALVDNYQNAERQLDAMRSAGLIGDAEYYTAKRSFIDLIDKAQEDALRKENARLQQQTLNTKDGLDRDRKVKENEAQIARLQAKATTDNILLGLQEKSAIDARTAALLSARQAAQDYFDTTNRGYARDLAAQGQGAQTRGYSAAISQIEERYQQQRTQLQNNRALAELSAPLTDKAKEQYDANIALLNEFQAKSISSYTGYYDKLLALQGDWTVGAREAFANYYDSARNVAYQTESLFGNAFRNLEDALVTFATTGKLSFKNLADSFVSELVRMEIKAAASSIFKSAGGASGLFGTVLNALGLGGSGATADTGGASQYSLGGSTSSGGLGLKLPGRAMGGPTSAGGMYEVLEGGRPELLNVGDRTYLMMGNQSGSVTPAGSAAAGGSGGGGGGNVYIENHASVDVQAQKVQRSDGAGFDWRVFVTPLTDALASDFSDRAGSLYHAYRAEQEGR